MNSKSNHLFFGNKRLDALIRIIIVLSSMILPLNFIGGGLGAIFALILPILIIFFLPIGTLSNNLREIGFYKPKKIGLLVLKGIIIGLLISFFFKTVISPLLETMLNSKRDLTAFYELKGNAKLLMVYVVRLILIAGFFEEIVFRGFLVSKFLKLFNSSNLGWFVSIFLAAVIFSFFHEYQGLSGILYTGLAGIVFGYVYKYFNKNLWYPILIHSTFDISSAVLIYLDQYDKVTSLFF